jgi:hypothetical protein
MSAVMTDMAAAKPICSMRNTSKGVTTTPPKLAPVNATLMARPRRRSNQRLTTVAITTVPMPIHPSDISASAA